MQTAEDLYAHYAAVRRRLMAGKVIHLRPPVQKQEGPAPTAPRTLTKTEAAIHDVANRHGFTAAEIIAPCRKKKFVNARHEAMYVLYAEHKRSLAFIARFFGNCNHTSVLHAVKRHKKILDAMESAEVS